MQELMNFSLYDVDLQRFNHKWEDVQGFCRQEGLDGIELLLGDNQLIQNIPRDLVRTVHLPGWFGWTRTWAEPQSLPTGADPLEISYYYGADNPHSLLTKFRSLLDTAANLDADYGVLHISHVELDEVYTQTFNKTTKEILSYAASFVNTTAASYPHGEPPVPIAFENLWWPGLTFQYEEDIRYFVDLLEFDNWIFLLDTGHLMNRFQIETEKKGIEKVVSTLLGLSTEIRDRIRSIHLQCSTSGAYQKKWLHCSPPYGFGSMSYLEKMTCLMEHIPHIDEHRAFSDRSCTDIIDLINPDYLVHEFITRSREELQQNIRTQRNLIS